MIMNFDDILFEMLATVEELSFERLREYQAKYPQYAEELAVAANEYREFEFALDAETIEGEELSEKSKTQLQELLKIFR